MLTNPHLLLCNGVNPNGKRPREWTSAATHELATFGLSKNVRLLISDLTDRMAARLPNRVRDLAEIAALVYAADQSCKRAGGVTIDYGDQWYRSFRFEIAVRDLDFWTRTDVLDCLSDTLGFLSDETYEFAFSKMISPPQFQDYLEFDAKTADPEPVDRVMLFSGGLDSLAGAVDEVLVNRRRVGLVSHKPVDHLAKKQRELVGEIAHRAKDPKLKPLHFPVLANRIGELYGDHTQRSRSFLYASLAAAVAGYFGLDEIFFYENGIVSINLPLCAQEIGGKATRTTHPKTLQGFGELFSLILKRHFTVHNPFIWDTKEDVLQRLKKAGHVDLACNSLSCSHTRQFTSKSPHCGMCSQCVSRRVASLGANYKDNDPATGYRADVIIGPRKRDEDRILAERFIGVARQVEAMTQVGEFHQKFAGELARVYSYLGMAPRLGAEKMFDLHYRHAVQVGKAMEFQMKEHISEWRKEQLADTCLLNYVCDVRQQPAGRPKREQADFQIGSDQLARVDEETFTVSLGSKSCAFSGRSKLLFQLFARINQRPGHQVTFRTLRENNNVWGDSAVEDVTIRGAVTRLRHTLRKADMGELADRISTGSYQHRPFVMLSSSEHPNSN